MITRLAEIAARDAVPEPSRREDGRAWDLVDLLRHVRDRIPENPDTGLSLVNIARAGLGSASNWLDASHQAWGLRPRSERYPVGPADMLAPFGIGVMGSLMSPRSVVGALGGRLGRTYESKNARIGAPDSLASNRAGFDFKPVKQRPFDYDYKGRPRSDETGRLQESIDGARLTAPLIAGRRSLGGGDEGLSALEQRAVLGALVDDVRPATQKLRGVADEDQPMGALLDPGDLGQYRPQVGSRPPTILYDRTLDPTDISRVLAHETGHHIATMARIPTGNLGKGGTKVYSDGRTGEQWRSGGFTRPEHLGYTKADAPDELMAEGIRAYMANPNYLKAVAPDLAARVRKYVNERPELSTVIQFNSRADAPGVPLARPVDRDTNRVMTTEELDRLIDAGWVPGES